MLGRCIISIRINIIISIISIKTNIISIISIASSIISTTLEHYIEHDGALDSPIERESTLEHDIESAALACRCSCIVPLHNRCCT